MAVSEAHVPVIRKDRINDRSASRRRRQVARSLAAGALAGAVAKTTIAPLDRTKISFQVSQEPYSWRAAGQYLKQTWQAEGVRALWRGNSATMARIVPYSACQFAAHEQWKRVLGVDTAEAAKERPLSHLLAGSLAGATSQSLTYPLDVARARMAVDHRMTTLRAAFAQGRRRYGWRGFYRGYTVTVAGVVPYAGVSFFTYETLKREYSERNAAAPPSGWARLLMGGCAGCVAQTASYPLDVVRRRMQTMHAATTVRHTAHAVWRTEGWRGFFKGLSMNWLKGPVAVGVSFATYDQALVLLTTLIPDER